MKQVMSLAHVIASLPSALHAKVEDLWADMIRTTFGHTLTGRAGDPSEAADCDKTLQNGRMGLVALVRIATLYLQSTLLLHDRLATCTSQGVDNVSSSASNGDNTLRKSPSKAYQNGIPPGKHTSISVQGDGTSSYGINSVRGHNDTAGSLDGQSVGYSPVVLLEMAWWMERRLDIARRRNEMLPAVELAELSQLLQSVVTHPTIRETFKQIFAKGESTPPLKRVIAFEVAVSGMEDVITASTKLAFVENVILSRVLIDSADGLDCEVGGCISDGQPSSGDCSTPPRFDPPSGGAKGVRNTWGDCVTALIEDSSLREAAERRVYRDPAVKESKLVKCFGNWHGSVKRAEEHTTHRLWAGKNCGRSCGVDRVQTLLGCALDVMRNMCVSEATAASISWANSPKSHLNETGRSHKKANRRGVSMLLTEAVTVLKKTDVKRKCAASALLVLLSEMAIPMVGASEGPTQAIEMFLLVWRGWFCKVRPLEYGVVFGLTRMALMCYGRQRGEQGASDAERGGCWVVNMLEDLPSLAVEMAKFWPSLASTLQPLIGLNGDNDASPPSPDGWPEHLSILHIVGNDLVKRLAGDNLGLPVSAEPTSKSEGLVQYESPGDAGCSRFRGNGRVPLGPVDNGLQGQRALSGQSKPGEQIDKQDDRVYARDASVGHKTAQAIVLGTAKLAQSRPRDAATALPRSVAAVIVDAVDTAATILVETPNKRPRQASAEATVYAKRTKPAAAVCGYGTENVPEKLRVHEAIHAVSGSFWGDRKLPKLNQWMAGLLEPLFGRESEKCNPPPLTVLLEAVVDTLRERKTMDGETRWRKIGLRDLSGVEQALLTSLFAGILSYAPSLVSRLVEAPFLSSSGALTASSKRQGMSLAVLDCLKRLSEEVPQWHTIEPATWLTAVLSHYGVASLSMTNVSKDSAIGGVAFRQSSGRAWEELVAFVHAQVRGSSSRELRLIPAAVALQEVDPLLKQYF